MMKNNRGFIAISVVYSFILVFLMIMLIVLSTYYNNRAAFNIYKDNIKVKAALGYTFENETTTYLYEEVKKQADLTSSSASGVRLDDSSYGSYRYFGKTPSNYICFGKAGNNCNDERYLFRIVGIFKESNVAVAGGGSYVTKIVRDKPLNTARAYNSTSANTWATSSLNNYLNNEYLNDASLSGFDDLFLNEMIIKAKWFAPALTSTSILPKEAYTKEMTAGSSFKTEAKVGLISVSDWGYAPQYIGNCKNTHLMDQFNNGLDYTCYLYNWLNYDMWFIDSSSSSGKAMTLDIKYNLNTSSVTTNTKRIFPAFYVNSKAVVMAGTGTRVDPYIINFLEE